MKKINDNGMIAEYDFSNGVRGKHYRQMQRGYTITIFNSAGTTTVKRVRSLKEIAPRRRKAILQTIIE
ncbi:hypothetical protein HY772_06250 [Candidatus Woesearchaeota archaeon]|nr:hypothetical protein [Candidatus Woesearchaeota archaeon]